LDKNMINKKWKIQKRHSHKLILSKTLYNEKNTLQ